MYVYIYHVVDVQEAELRQVINSEAPRPGKLLEEVDEDVRLHHLVTLTAPPFESMVEVEVQGNDALLPLESFMAGPGLSCGHLAAMSVA